MSMAHIRHDNKQNKNWRKWVSICGVDYGKAAIAPALLLRSCF
jgi:hypothetical protein